MLPTLLALALAAGSPAQQPVPLSVGDRVPALALEPLHQTPAGSAQELHGRALFLHFFAYWSEPSERFVGRLNSLQERFGPAGLTVLGVTKEDARKTAPWIERVGIAHAFVYATSGELANVTQVPFGVLIDAFGFVRWMGKPSRLWEMPVDLAVEGAGPVPLWEWPAEARSLAAPLSEGRYAEAFTAARALPSAASEAVALLQGLVQIRAAQVERLVARGERLDALRVGTLLEKELAGLPEALLIAARVAELRADPEVQRQLAVMARLDELERSIRKSRKELEALLEQPLFPEVERRIRARLAFVGDVLEGRRAKREKRKKRP